MKQLSLKKLWISHNALNKHQALQDQSKIALMTSLWHHQGYFLSFSTLVLPPEPQKTLKQLSTCCAALTVSNLRLCLKSNQQSPTLPKPPDFLHNNATVLAVNIKSR